LLQALTESGQDSNIAILADMGNPRLQEAWKLTGFLAKIALEIPQRRHTKNLIEYTKEVHR